MWDLSWYLQTIFILLYSFSAFSIQILHTCFQKKLGRLPPCFSKYNLAMINQSGAEERHLFPPQIYSFTRKRCSYFSWRNCSPILRNVNLSCQNSRKCTTRNRIVKSKNTGQQHHWNKMGKSHLTAQKVGILFHKSFLKISNMGFQT